MGALQKFGGAAALQFQWTRRHWLFIPSGAGMTIDKRNENN